ncbi:MAG: HD domain-containing phosphohydrolase [Betaproteobacteria bacterium]
MINVQEFNNCSVLIVDDQPTSRTILAQVVKSINASINVIEQGNPVQALEWAVSNKANLVFIDYLMPEMNGTEFVKRLKMLPGYESVPVMMITINSDTNTRYAALEAGVADFINKPFDIQECTARSKNLLTMNIQHIALQDKSILLEGLVHAATAEIKAREKETLMRLARAGEYKDYDTAMHLQRMSLYSRALANTIGLSEDEAEIVELAAPLHDIGKIGTPDSILLKQGPLTDDELKIMRRHPMIGYKILEGSPSKYLQKGGEIALAHHERFDGSGYPNGLIGEEIPLAARIVAIADVFDALTSARPYKEAWRFDRAFKYIWDEGGKHFDPELVEAMQSIRDIFKRIHAENSVAVAFNQ